MLTSGVPGSLASELSSRFRAKAMAAAVSSASVYLRALPPFSSSTTIEEPESRSLAIVVRDDRRWTNRGLDFSGERSCSGISAVDVVFFTKAFDADEG
jgi:hypothetical protein